MTEIDRLINSQSFEAVLDSLTTFGNPTDLEYKELVSCVSQRVIDILEQPAQPDNRVHHPAEKDKTFRRQNSAAIKNYEQAQQKANDAGSTTDNEIVRQLQGLDRLNVLRKKLFAAKDLNEITEIIRDISQTHTAYLEVCIPSSSRHFHDELGLYLILEFAAIAKSGATDENSTSEDIPRHLQFKRFIHRTMKPFLLPRSDEDFFHDPQRGFTLLSELVKQKPNLPLETEIVVPFEELFSDEALIEDVKTASAKENPDSTAQPILESRCPQLVVPRLCRGHAGQK